MASLRDIRRRIGSLKNIEKITRAVKMVEVAKMRRAQDRVIAMRPYAEALQRMLGDLVVNAETLGHPLIAQRERKNAAVVVVTADRGLCGAFNTNVIRLAARRIQELRRTLPDRGDVFVFCAGKKACEYFSRRKYDLAGEYAGIFQDLHFSAAQEIMRDVVGGYRSAKYDYVEAVYSEFKSISHQQNTVAQLLPFAALPAEEISRTKEESLYLYEPSAQEVLERLLPKTLNMQMWRWLLESNASEHSARMIAMDNATKNAGDLITALSLVYNKARQGSITKEILEIVGGAEALKGAA